MAKGGREGLAGVLTSHLPSVLEAKPLRPTILGITFNRPLKKYDGQGSLIRHT